MAEFLQLNWVWRGVLLLFSVSFEYLAQAQVAQAQIARNQIAQNQIVPDRSLPVASTVTPQGDRLVIRGGTQTERNLFHSFRHFSVPQGRTVAFEQVALQTVNIFTRVTGGAPSRINGRIEVLQPNGQISPANLFLINPQGILIGPQASLNLGGSFLATTATQINFADGIQFSADPSPNSSQPALLSVSTPVGLQFGQMPGRIENASSVPLLDLQTGEPIVDAGEVLKGGLQVPGGSIALVGGEIRFTGGAVVANGGRLELGSVGAGSLVSLSTVNQQWHLGYETADSFGKIELNRASLVDASGNESGGDIQLRAAQISLTGGSEVVTQILGAQNGGSIQIRADELTVSGCPDSALCSGIGSSTFGAGRAADMQINTRRLTIREGGFVGITNEIGSTGQGGDLTVHATEAIEISGGAVFEHGEFSNSLLLTTAKGDETGAATGKAGNLTVVTDRLELQAGGQMSTITFGSGNAGTMRIQADTIEIAGVLLNSAGEIFVTEGRVLVSGLSTQTNASGNGGDLVIQTGRLGISQGGVVRTSTYGSGQAGNLTIIATDQIDVQGFIQSPNGTELLRSNIASSSGGIPGLDRNGNLLKPSASGRGGQLRVQTPTLRVLDQAVIAVGSANPNPAQAQGAGSLDIQAQTIQLDQGSLLARTNSGDGGNITLAPVQTLLLRNQSEISTTAGLSSTGGNGGDLTINADYILATPFENSDISANAYSGRGGNVRIQTLGLVGLTPRDRPTELSDITASSEFGLSGTIQINSTEVELNRGLIELPTATATAEPTQGCYAPGRTSTAAFFNTGHSGIALTPYESLSENPILDDVQLPQSLKGDRQPSPAISRSVLSHSAISRSVMPTIVEAQGWQRSPDGKIILVADNGNRRPLSACQGG